MRDRHFFCLLILCLAISWAQPGYTQSIIRDTEIERTLREWSAPIFQSAGLNPQNVNIILIKRDAVNAFVAGGPNIFLFTGLIEKAENPSEIIGIIAHETGHISAGHLVRLRQSVEQASFETIVGTVLGIGAAILSGEGAAANAIISGTQSIAAQRFLSNSRLNESSADQAALRFMNESGIDPKGLVSFLDKLKDDELLPPEQQSEYARTHPLTTNRMEALQRGVGQSPHAETALPPEWVKEFKRMKAKLAGFIHPQQVAWNYNENDNAVPARYARAIAAYQTNQFDEAIDLINHLIREEPNNPYFHELKGQILVDFGRIDQALAPYKQAVTITPEAGLIRTAYAHALIESAGRTNKARLEEAIQQLKQAALYEKRSARVHRLMATAFGRLGDDATARLHLAEEALLQGRSKDARRFAEFTRSHSEEGSRNQVRAKDILNFIQQGQKDL